MTEAAPRDAGRPPVRLDAAVVAVVVVLERDRLPAAGAEAAGRRPVALVVAGHRVDRGLRLVGRLHPDIAVAGDARARRDELADDDVLLQAEQRVAPGGDRRVGED